MTTYNNLFRTFDDNFIGFATMVVLAQSCLGGVAAMSVLANGTSIGQMIQLTIVVLISILTNTSILAQMKHKTIFNLTLASLVVNTLLIIINAI
ncbi:hypothetical protein SLW70_01940 [Flavobacterium sp. NG2]|uniref:hypothetical protein n=1 Tax=Flavobacterium sp. NG2 TaxID=3097547 RepID=UPI002A807A2A|nr:hypothetical protein [Flavobacterium sp. NG2]WPR71913.1 hypothetical protein SLW70_01940 [Flavobacterium sp. NG2]